MLRYTLLRVVIIAYLWYCSSPIVKAQFRVDIYPTEEFMIKEMLIRNNSVKVWNVEFGGAHDARGVFYNNGTILPISQGLILSTGNAIDATGANLSPSTTGYNRTKGDPDIHYLAKYRTFDASWISFEFEPDQNLICFNYVFASEEYPEYVGSAFNDAFGFFLTDLVTGEVANLAVIPGTHKPITVNNINYKNHSNFYISNKTGNEESIEFDGLTSRLIAYSEVIPHRKYHIKIAIADVADDAFDSGVFLEGKSFESQEKSTFYEKNKQYFRAFSDEKIIVNIPSNNPINTQKQTEKPLHQSKKKSTPSKYAPDSLVILFDFDKSYPIPESLEAAEERLQLVKLQYYHIRVVGHTDQKGNNHYNTILSRKRADYVKNWLNTKYNTKINEVYFKSFKQLVNTQTTETARAQNRRVVIYFKARNRK